MAKGILFESNKSDVQRVIVCCATKHTAYERWKTLEKWLTERLQGWSFNYFGGGGAEGGEARYGGLYIHSAGDMRLNLNE